ncbi:hypothetical protein HDA39_003643 [Kribbella italica]|uniref:Uncharacterized protein n=1 Tax=Kribbella italica TaxID=1540520 RepID=A0A7W9MUN2_9ACTN|nr:hypothetical protein [Kribbella italica]
MTSAERTTLLGNNPHTTAAVRGLLRGFFARTL